MAIGILNAYHWDGDANSYQVKYRPMSLGFLQKAFPGQEIRFYEIPAGEWPANIHECETWIISGSAKSCYEDDDWIAQLIHFSRDCYEAKVKQVGFCFGHQLIAKALGGQVQKSEKGWGIGVRRFQILESQEWMDPKLSSVSLLYSHQDQVTELPAEAIRLGQSDFCQNESFRIADHILCFQGHPEFSREYARERYLSRSEQIGVETVDEALESLSDPLCDREVWEWIKRFSKSRG